MVEGVRQAIDSRRQTVASGRAGFMLVWPDRPRYTVVKKERDSWFCDDRTKTGRRPLGPARDCFSIYLRRSSGPSRFGPSAERFPNGLSVRVLPVGEPREASDELLGCVHPARTLDQCLSAGGKNGASR